MFSGLEVIIEELCIYCKDRVRIIIVEVESGDNEIVVKVFVWICFVIEDIELLSGYLLEWGGEFESFLDV